MVDFSALKIDLKFTQFTNQTPIIKREIAVKDKEDEDKKSSITAPKTAKKGESSYNARGSIASMSSVTSPVTASQKYKRTIA